jgi:hypothetical protein
VLHAHQGEFDSVLGLQMLLGQIVQRTNFSQMVHHNAAVRVAAGNSVGERIFLFLWRQINNLLK